MSMSKTSKHMARCAGMWRYIQKRMHYGVLLATYMFIYRDETRKKLLPKTQQTFMDIAPTSTKRNLPVKNHKAEIE